MDINLHLNDEKKMDENELDEEYAAMDENAFTAGIAKLSEFSTVLSNALSTLGKTVHNIEDNFRHTKRTVASMKEQLANHDVALTSYKSRPKSSARRPLSHQSRPRSNTNSQTGSNLHDNEVLDDVEELPKPQVNASLIEAMALLHDKELRGISITKLHDDLHETHEIHEIPEVNETDSKQTNDIDVPIVSNIIENEAAEMLFEKLAIRINELEDCIKIQEAVNVGLNNAINNQNNSLGEQIKGINFRLHETDIRIEQIESDLKYISSNVRTIEKNQKKMDSNIDNIQKAILNLQTRPKSTRSNQGLATPISRPKSSYIKLENNEIENNVSNENLNTIPLENNFTDDLSTSSTLQKVTKPEDEVPGTLLFGDVDHDGDGLLDTNYEELFQRIELLEKSNNELNTKLSETTNTSSENQLSVRRIVLELQDVNSQLDGLLHHDASKSPRNGNTSLSPINGRDFTNQEILGAALTKLKKAWIKVFEDLAHALEKLETSGILTLHTDPFYLALVQFKTKLLEVNNLLENDLSDVNAAKAAATASSNASTSMKDPATQTKKINYINVLQHIHPLLYNLQVDAEHLVELDRVGRVTSKQKDDHNYHHKHHKHNHSHNTLHGSNNDESNIQQQQQYGNNNNQHHSQHQHHRRHDDDDDDTPLYKSTLSFDDCICADESNTFGFHLIEAMLLTMPVLDELIDKFHLKVKIEYLEKKIQEKAKKSTLNNLETEVRQKLASKVDHTDFTTSVMKKCSVAELQQFREMAYKQLDDLRNAVANLEIHGSGGNGNSNSQFVQFKKDDSKANDNTAAVLEAERTVIFNRFELLYKQFTDLTQYCEKFVPRDEVEKAMHAVVVQVKTLKSTAVDTSVMKEALKKKADAEDVKRLIDALEKSIGELSGSTASAVHARCLLCDKIVSKATDSEVHLDTKLSDNLLDMSKKGDTSPDKSVHKRVQTAQEKKLSQKLAKEFKDSMQTNTELAIMRCSVDLPPLNDDGVSFRPNSTTSNTKYTERIRSSAGGGLSYSKTTSVLPVNNNTTVPGSYGGLRKK